MYRWCLVSPDLAVILAIKFQYKGLCLSLAMSIFTVSNASLYSLLRYRATTLMKRRPVWKFEFEKRSDDKAHSSKCWVSAWRFKWLRADTTYKKEQNERSSSIETKCLFVIVIIINIIIIIIIIIIITLINIFTIVIIRIIKPSLALYPMYSHCYRLVWNVSLPHPLTHRERTPIG